MKKLWTGFLLGMNLFVGLSDSAEAAGKRRLISFEDLATQLSRDSDGAIQKNPALAPTCQAKNSPCTNFERKEKPAGFHWDSEKATEDAFLQSVFQTDEDRFVANHGGGTFLEAKEQAYQSIPFKVSKRSYLLPFENLRGWGSLIHPPIFELSKDPGFYFPGLGPVDHSQVQHPYYTEEFQRRMDEVSKTELTSGNDVEYLGGGPISHQAKLALIKNAKKSMWVQVMVFACDPYSLQLHDALVERRRAGVDVRLMIEGLYARIVFRGCVKRFRKGDVDLVMVDDSTRLKTFARVAHPKVWLRDGEEAIMGGINILESEAIGDGFTQGNRDSDVWVKRGPIVTDLLKQYIEIWKRNATKKNRSIDSYAAEIDGRLANERAAGVRGEGVYQNALPDPIKRSQGVCRVAVQRENNKVEPIAPMLALYASQLQNQLIATTPGLKVNKKFKMKHNSLDAFWVELQKASNQRGARIDLITNGIDGQGGDLTKPFRGWRDSARDKDNVFFEKMTQALVSALAIMNTKGNYKHAQRLYKLGDGFHAWNYLRYGHQKVQIFDRTVTSIGSFNLDGHSAWGNQEGQMFCMDTKLADQTERAMTVDFINATPVYKE